MSAFLDAAVRVARPDHTTDVAITAASGEVVALAGPNGAGKTTVLRSLAGTLAHAGHVRVGGEDWTALPSYRRRIGLVHQDHALFPHLSALDNVAYGPRARGVRRGEARARAQALLDRVGVGELSSRRPGALSGGQSQRVAVARALATEPRLLLLDEPFAALDVAVAQGLRDVLADVLVDFDGVTLLVTHDPVDLFTLAQRLVVLEDGRVRQDSPVAEAAAAPASAHTARLLGRNVLHGRSMGTTVHLDDGPELVVAHRSDGPVIASFAPSAVTLTGSEPTGSARNRWPVEVRRVVPAGDVLRVHVAPPSVVADLTSAAVEDLGVVPGSRLWASVKATDVDVVPAGR